MSNTLPKKITQARIRTAKDGMISAPINIGVEAENVNFDWEGQNDVSVNSVLRALVFSESEDPDVGELVISNGEIDKLFSKEEGEKE